MRTRLLGRWPAAALLAALAGAGAPAQGAGQIFVSSEKDHVVTVLDAESYEVVRQVRTGGRPRHLQLSPDGTRLFVACGDGNSVDIIDLQKLEVVDRIAGIDDPEAFDLSPDGRTMYITLEDIGALGVIDSDTYFAERGEKPELTLAEASTEAREEDDEEEEEEEEGEGSDDEGPELLPGMTVIEVGKEPEGILVSPDGTTAYVTSEVANMVHVVDTASQTLTANVLVGNRPRRMAYNADLTELWVSNELSGSVSIVDPATNKVTGSIEFLPPGFRPEDVTPVGITLMPDRETMVVALGRANHVAFVNVASRKIEDFVLVGNRPWNASLNRDGSRLYVVNGLSDDVSVIDVAKRRVIKSVPVGRVPYAALIRD